MTNDTFLDEATYDDQDHQEDLDLNDGLDEGCYPDERHRSSPPSSPYNSPYGSYGSYGPYSRPWDQQKAESSITQNLLSALLKSHSREIALLKQIIKNSTAPSDKLR